MSYTVTTENKQPPLKRYLDIFQIGVADPKSTTTLLTRYVPLNSQILEVSNELPYDSALYQKRLQSYRPSKLEQLDFSPFTAFFQTLNFDSL